MKIYDKASWHIDAGMDEHEVVEKFRSVFNSLERLDLLSDEGYEISELGIDDSISLNENMVTKRDIMMMLLHITPIRFQMNWKNVISLLLWKII